jgi:hypothetical protein
MKYVLGAVVTALLGVSQASAATISTANIPHLATNLISKVGFDAPCVPEPASWMLMIASFALLGWQVSARRRKAQAKAQA